VAKSTVLNVALESAKEKKKPEDQKVAVWKEKLERLKQEAANVGVIITGSVKLKQGR
jgi:hypothetical protein